MKKKGMFKKLLAGTLSAAMILGMTAITSMAAPNPETKGSITVHKYTRGTQATTPGTGNEITGADLAALGQAAEGVKFSLKKITLPTLGEGVNFTQDAPTFTYDGDGRVTGVTFATSGTPGTAAGIIDNTFDELTGTTDAQGQIVFGKDGETSNLDQGYYLLEETQGLEGYDKAVPSVISIPLTKADGTDYLYDVHVYPKNVSNNENLITKTIDGNDGTTVINPGEEFTWNIEAKFDTADKDFTVNSLKDGTKYGTFVITDTMPVGMTYVKTPSVSVGGTTLTVTDDYTVTINGQTITWTLTNAGIDKAIAANAASMKVQVTTKYSSFVTSGETPAGLTNHASSKLTPATGEPGTDPEVDTKVPKLNIKITKSLSDEAKKIEGISLEGIEFKISDKQNPTGDEYIKGADGTDLVAKTDTNGFAVFEGLTYDKVNGSTYYIFETKTKPGLQLKKDAIKVVVEAGKTPENTSKEITVSTSAIVNYAQTETDPDNPTFQLPLTGGTGTVIFTIVAILCFAGAVVVIKRAKRRKA